MPEVHLFMARGRSSEQKRAVMAAITDALVTHLECAPDVVTVQIIEAEWSEKMKGGRTFEERYSAEIPAGYRQATGEPPPD